MSAFVAKIDLKLADKLQDDLLSQGFTFSTPPHTLFLAKKQGISCTLYESGKLMVQGKEKGDFITFYLEPEILGNLSFSHPQTLVNLQPRIGVDEAGKGDFFGPLSIAGVYADEERIQKLVELKIRDSKQLSDQKITTLATEIRSYLPHSIIRLNPVKYNELYGKFKNLNSLLAWGHATVIEELSQKTGCKRATIDQFANGWVMEKAIERKGLSIDLTQRHRGEEDLVVAAGSILARADFVAGIKALGENIRITLPKGASSLVIDAGKQILAKHGEETLKTLCKWHFKTLKAIEHA